MARGKAAERKSVSMSEHSVHSLQVYAVSSIRPPVDAFVSAVLMIGSPAPPPHPSASSSFLPSSQYPSCLPSSPPPLPSLLALNLCLPQSPKTRTQKEATAEDASGWAKGWEDDDCGGNVDEAERLLFNNVLAYLNRSNMKQLFKEMDKEGSGDLDFTEFRFLGTR